MFMSKIIADCTRDNNYSVAIVDKNGNLDAFSFENQQKKTIKSNIYLGRITRVEYSLQAAFVEYGGDKAGFLPFSEIHPNYYQLPIKYKQELQKAIMAEDKDNASRYENDDELDDDDAEEEEKKEKMKNIYKLSKKYSIQEVIKRGQTVISKKAYSYENRKRVMNIIRKFNIPYGTGLIVRTAGVNASEKDLQNDYNYLTNLWDDIRNRVVHAKIDGTPIYEEADIVSQVIRDNYDNSNDTEIIISGKDGYEKVYEYVNKLMPEESGNVKLYKDRMSIFKKFGIDKKLEQLLNPIAPLKSGGYLVINPTEALVSIDVNSGKSIHGKNVEETALATNIEAAHEVARQLRLRNLGGLIVVDFIDMDDPKNRFLLEKELQKVFMLDKAKVQFAKISQFGLVEISRQRMRSSIAEMLAVPCPCCNGIGLVKAPSVISVDILDSIKEQLLDPRITKKPFLEVMASKEVLEFLVTEHIKEIEDIQKKHGIKIITTKHQFEKNEEYIIRLLENVGDVETAVELYHSVMAKFEIASEEKKHTKPIFNVIRKALKALKRRK